MNHTTSSSRRLIYLLLLLVIVASITLSVFMERTAHNIRRNETPLLNSIIPQLRYLGDFESAVLRYQLALSKRSTDSITPDRFRSLESMGRSEIDATSRNCAPAWQTGPERVHCATATSAWSPWRRSSSATPAATPPARAAVLIRMNEEVKRPRLRIDDLQQHVEQAIHDSGSMANHAIGWITALVHVFDVLALVTCVFLMSTSAPGWMEDELSHQASHDPLTGLAHRRSFEARLALCRNCRIGGAGNHRSLLAHHWRLWPRLRRPRDGRPGATHTRCRRTQWRRGIPPGTAPTSPSCTAWLARTRRLPAHRQPARRSAQPLRLRRRDLTTLISAPPASAAWRSAGPAAQRRRRAAGAQGGRRPVEVYSQR
jgi:hypothetical protein